MTHQDVFIKILQEVSGKSKVEIEEFLETIKRVHPGGDWDKILSESEANQLLTQLRSDKQGIINWLAEGAAKAAHFESSTKH